MDYVPNVMDTSNYPGIRTFVYSDAGRMKTTLAASFPKPMLVLALDPLDKMTPYRRRGLKGPRVNPDSAQGIYVPTEYVMSTKAESRAAIQMEYYIDRTAFDPDATSAWELIQDRMNDLYHEDSQGMWGTIVIDSMSQLEYVIRRHHQFKENPVTKDGNEQDQRQWYRKSAEGIEQVTYAAAWFNANVVVTAHVRAEKDALRDTILWTPEAPGVRNRRIPSIFGEIYTMHIDATVTQEDVQNGVSPVIMQTHPDGKFMAATQINAPDNCMPKYGALWAHYDRSRTA